MTTTDVWTLATLIAAALVAAAQFRDARRAPAHRVLIRLMAGLLLLYFSGLYLYALVGPDVYLIRSGILTRAGQIIVFVTWYLDMWTLRRAQRGVSIDANRIG